jgi:hypothetical protein
VEGGSVNNSPPFPFPSYHGSIGPPDPSFPPSLPPPVAISTPGHANRSVRGDASLSMMEALHGSMNARSEGEREGGREGGRGGEEEHRSCAGISSLQPNPFFPRPLLPSPIPPLSISNARASSPFIDCYPAHAPPPHFQPHGEQYRELQQLSYQVDRQNLEASGQDTSSNQDMSWESGNL